ncbi:acetylornithine deacetylase [Paracoccus laeviglucosivorans]|uniref:Acetylornithine deacetylase n=1 Tax=Paracoccus laeviglucosivorans TaxID=1197861 RepID=A0A521FIZ7_9RHOB|nr:acetylornithine deacetylase [Paracoccus laeviglucosivorans]SMO96177.1 acetylornithine deacetylase [Paracoccus laeviglucosivorans]
MTKPYDATLALLERLISFQTVSAQSNLALIQFAEDHLRDAGFQVHHLPSQTGPKAGLLARLGEGSGGIMLSAHSDVVPVTGQNWSRPEFTLTQDGERLYGRGTTDMKGFLAAMLALAGRTRGVALKRPLMMCISYDEEVGCTGIREMLPGYQALRWQPELCIVGEPTSMRPAIGHKGKVAFRATCRGQAGHSSLAPKYVNALHLAADLIGILRQLQDEYAASAGHDHAYDIPYSTVHVGRVQGGTALNIVADLATLEFELRHIGGDDPADFIERLNSEIEHLLRPYQAICPEADIVVETTNAYPGLTVYQDDPVVHRVSGFSGNEAPIKVAFGTEAGYFAGIGIPTVVCGPGDMEGQGHKPDEYLEVGQLAACDRMLDRVLESLT